MRGDRVEVGFSDIGGLLHGLLHRFQGVRASGDGALEHGNSGLAASRGVLGGVVDDGQELLLGFGGLRLERAAEFGTGARRDVVQVAAVGGGLLSQGLEHRGLQGQQFLRVLDAQQGLGRAGGFGQGGLGGGQVQLDELLDAFECLAGQTEQGFDGGFLREVR